MSLLNDIFRFSQFLRGACTCIDVIIRSERRVSILEFTTGVASFVLMLYDMIHQGNASSLCRNRDIDEIIDQSKVLVPGELSSFFKTVAEQLSISLNGNLKICDSLEPMVLDSIDTSDSFNLIICDVIESNGLIKQNVLKNLKFALEMSSTPLNQHPCVVPSSISIVIAAIQCESFIQQQSVQRQNTLGINVSTCVNELGTSLLRELWLPTQSDLTFISEQIVVTSLDLCSSHYKSSSKIHLKVKESGTLHGIAFWYHIHMNSKSLYQGETYDKIVIDTYKQDNHYRQAVFLLDCSEKVTTGDILEIDVSINETSGVFCSFVGRRNGI